MDVNLLQIFKNILHPHTKNNKQQILLFKYYRYLNNVKFILFHIFYFLILQLHLRMSRINVMYVKNSGDVFPDFN